MELQESNGACLSLLLSLLLDPVLLLRRLLGLGCGPKSQHVRPANELYGLHYPATSNNKTLRPLTENAP